MSKIYKKNETYYYRNGNKLYSCYLAHAAYWPYYPGNTKYEEHTIESEVENEKMVSYNRPKNWIRVEIVGDEGPQIVSWGDAFDNGPESTYYITVAGSDKEYVYIGGPGYFKKDTWEFTTVRPACYTSFWKNSDGWSLASSFC